MQGVPADQGVLADLVVPDEQEVDVLTEERSRATDGRAHCDGPEGELVPGEQVSGEGEKKGRDEQEHADYPVELPRRLVGAGVEDAAHVEKDRDDHALGSPPVHVPHQLPEGDAGFDVLHALVRQISRGYVVEHQEDAGHDQHEEHKEGEAAQAERVGDFGGVPLDLDWVDVEEDVAGNDERLIALGIGVAVPDHRAPDGRPGDAIGQSLFSPHALPPGTVVLML